MFICLFLWVNAQASWINLDSSDPVESAVEVTESDAYGVTFHVEIKGFYSEDTTDSEVN